MNRVRSLDITGKDGEFPLAFGDPQHAVSCVTDKKLREVLTGTPRAKGGPDKQVSARVSRHLRPMRDHGLIRKRPNQRKCSLTGKGRSLAAALGALLAASTQMLVEVAA